MTGAGRTRVVGVDGRSGAGKTTLATALATALARALGQVVGVFHLEDLYPGWDGLTAGRDRYRREVLEPLVDGLPSCWTDWDWAHDRPGRLHRIEPGGVLVAEGVGAGHATARPLLDALIWLEVPTARRRDRALARDGAVYRPYWERWAAQEEAWLQDDDVATAADVVVTGEPDPADLARRVLGLLGPGRAAIPG